MRTRSDARLVGLLGLAALLSGCPGGGSEEGVVVAATAETCMTCHNGSPHDDYSGPGLENPHPFSGAATLKCTACHGGNPLGATPETAHVPAPPEIGDRAFQDQNALAYFNRLTLSGIDKLADYDVNGVTYTALDYLQFVNPGDLRVLTDGTQRSCAACHQLHVDCTNKSLLATQAGMLSGAQYMAGNPSSVPQSDGLYEDTASDLGWRAKQDPMFGTTPGTTGAVEELNEYPVFSVRNATGPDAIDENPAYASPDLDDDIDPSTGKVIAGSPLSNLFHEQVAFTCGDCHLGSAGANNRSADYRGSGCTSCHMKYALDGRSRSTDPNINKLEPLDPDDIDDPERPHLDRHLIRSVARTLVTGEFVQGMDDYTCAGCHQGSNRTVMQYWGIRLDQNADLARRVQYPANPVRFVNTANDKRLFPDDRENREFNGRNPNQYILFEDYDGDGRDDTPADVHYDAGMGCIDCHGSHDLHGGRVGDPNDAQILSRQEQAVSIACENCHGTIDAYAPTMQATAFNGQVADVAVDKEGYPIDHVLKEADGEYYLYSRLTGQKHWVSQLKDVIADNGKVNPFTGDPVYNAKASYAMGRADGDPTTGQGPVQGAPILNGFTHTDNVSCAGCHASWTNTCTGCHLKGEYNRGNNFSNVTGERIVYRETNADFVYQTPVPFQLGVDTHNKIASITSNTNTFYQYKDLNDEWSNVFTFSDRNGGGTAVGNPSDYPSLSHNVLMPHSIRGRVSLENEGPRYCVACHLTTRGLGEFGAQYDAFRQAMATNDWKSLDFQLLQQHIGRNPGNRLDSPIWVHQVVGLGSGLFLMDENGCPVNPLDENDERVGCEDPPNSNIFTIPAVTWLTVSSTLTTTVKYNLDRIVEPNGQSTGSQNHVILEPGLNLRDGAQNPALAGPLGATLIRRLSDPNAVDAIILDTWFDANGDVHGVASTTIPLGP